MSTPTEKSPKSGFAVDLPGTPTLWLAGIATIILFFALHLWALLFLAGFATGWWAKYRMGQK